MLYVIPIREKSTSVVHVSKIDETKLWYRKLGHLNLISMRNIVFGKTIFGLLNIKIDEGIFFWWMSNRKTNQNVTKEGSTSYHLQNSRTDPHGSHGTHAIRGKIHVFVCVDGFLKRYT